MKLITLLHLYQPHNQQFDILDRIVNESYRPLTEGLLKVPNGKVVINISGALTKLLIENNYQDVIDNIKKLASNGQIEFTASAMYHAFLHLLSELEIKRQIELNNDINSRVFGKYYKPVGFFSPEMAVNKKVTDVVASLGYKWIAASELASPNGSPDTKKLHKLDNGLSVFYRNKRVSSLMLSGVVRDPKQLLKETEDLHQDSDYFFVVMDAETFGHHRVGHEEFLLQLLDSNLINPTLPSELLDSDMPVATTKIRPSTWTNEEQDFWLDKKQSKKTEAKSFILWKDPDNPIHTLQWGLTDFVIDKVTSYSNKDEKKWKKSRALLDSALASDQYWWASTKPWWSLELIEQGAFSLIEVVKLLFGEDSSQYSHVLDLYRAILDQAFLWQRGGVIRKKHLDNSSTYMKKSFKDRAPAEWYNQIVLEFEDQMKIASVNNRFEEAIKWRDALLKLKGGTDIYDVLHVVDELWTARNIPALKPFLDHDWNEISPFIRKFLRDVKTKEDFDLWKKNKL